MPRGTHTIILNVDTSLITVHNQNEFQICHFEEQAPNTDSRDFSIDAAVGDMVRWEGVSSVSDDHVVKITSINHQGGKNIFGKNVLKDTRQKPWNS